MGSPAGPSNPTPPPGPHRALVTDERIARAIAAELAGRRGRSAEPLDPRRRLRTYWQQNGTDRFTPKQRRRAEHKAWRAMPGTAA